MSWEIEAEKRLPALRAEIPEGRWARWRWKRRRRRLEYDLFRVPGGVREWMVVKEENNRLGVWR